MLQEQPRTAGNLRLWTFALAYWRTNEEARTRLQNGREDSRNDHPRIGLGAWADRMHHLFKPEHLFFACGTWSNPKANWVLNTATVNSGAYPPLPHDGHRHHLGKAAYSAAAAYSLNRVYDWDLLISCDTDSLVGATDLNAIVREFWNRPEILCAPNWFGVPGGPLLLFKREAVSRLIHNRECSNFRDQDQEPESLWEAEINYLFRPTPEGMPRWWNAWPGGESYIFDPQPQADLWPMVSTLGGDLEYTKRYEATQSPLTIPYRRDVAKC